MLVSRVSGNKTNCAHFLLVLAYTVLSDVSRNQTSVRHLAGSVNLPSDFQRKKARICDEPMCQMCSFVSTSIDSVGRSIYVQKILKGHRRVSYLRVEHLGRNINRNQNVCVWCTHIYLNELDPQVVVVVVNLCFTSLFGTKGLLSDIVIR